MSNHTISLLLTFGLVLTMLLISGGIVVLAEHLEKRAARRRHQYRGPKKNRR